MASQPKKSLFSKPAFSRGKATKVSSGSTAIDLFSRADLSYSAFVEEEEEKRAERKNAKAARKATDSRGEDESVDNARKRQRVSISSSDTTSEEGNNDDRRSRTLSPPASKKVDLTSRTKASRPSVTGSRPQPSQKEPELPVDNNRNAASSKLDEQEAEVVFVPSSSPAQQSEEVDLLDADDQEEDEGESDDEIAELARKAREAARKKQESRAENAIHSDQTDPSLPAQNNRSAEANPTPFIMISVESPLPGAESKTFKRRLDQRLRQVRLIWCEANGFSEEERQKIILMFRGRRVFDVNTPESLGICVDNQGEPYVRGDDPLAPLDTPGEIVMEAIREDQEEEYASNWRKEHGRMAAEDEDKTTEAQPDPLQTPVKIICRARNFPDFKVAVKMATTVLRIQAAFAMQNGLPDGTEVFIMLDGEILEADATIADLGIEDMDVLDVQVKHT